MSSTENSTEEIQHQPGLCRASKRPSGGLSVSAPYPRPLSDQRNLGGSENLPKAKTTRPRPSNGRVKTDVLLAIKAVHLSRIINREKNFEFRKYRLKEGVERIWFYETAGDAKSGRGRASITHIATTSPNIRYTKGQIPEIPAGIGNREFNAGLKTSKYAYPLLNEVGTRPPMGWLYVKKDLWEIKWGVLGPENEAVVRVF